MFQIEVTEPGQVTMKGRLDAAQSEKAELFLDGVDGMFVINLSDLEYISSAGLGVLLKTHKRLVGTGAGLKLVQVNSHIANIFKYSGFDKLFEIEVNADAK
jgi:anti-anti-sigma factor